MRLHHRVLGRAADINDDKATDSTVQKQQQHDAIDQHQLSRSFCPNPSLQRPFSG